MLSGATRRSEASFLIRTPTLRVRFLLRRNGKVVFFIGYCVNERSIYGLKTLPLEIHSLLCYSDPTLTREGTL